MARKLGKRDKWRLNRDLERVFEPPIRAVLSGRRFLAGTWQAEVFGNPNPITLELGCGQGHYTVELARRHPERNFVGVDVKGHRFWTGADLANREGLSNVAFLRAKIEFIESYFDPGEVSEFWLTFSDPQPRDGKGTKRITSRHFLERYRRIAPAGSTVHIKTDSPLVYQRALEECGELVELASDDVYGELVERVDEATRNLLEIRTKYEQRWLGEGRLIHYVRLRLPEVWSSPEPGSEPDSGPSRG